MWKLCFKGRVLDSGGVPYFNLVHIDRGSFGASLILSFALDSNTISLYCAQLCIFSSLNIFSVCVFAIIEKGEIVGKVRTLTSHTRQFRCCQTKHSLSTRYVDALLFHVFQGNLGCTSSHGSQEGPTGHQWLGTSLKDRAM